MENWFRKQIVKCLNRVIRLFQKKPQIKNAINYGCVPSTKDDRDFKTVSYSESIPQVFELPAWTIKNQGSYNSCTAFGTCSAMEVLFFEKESQGLNLSERDLWYQTRQLEGTLPENVGCQIRNVLKIAQKQGVSPDALCPYTDVNVTPNIFAQSFRRFYRIGEYYACLNHEDVINALGMGYPVIIGMMVDRAFESLRSNGMLVPTPPFNGAHCMYLIGYDIPNRQFKMMNSWDAYWGQNGWCLLPFDVFDNKSIVFEAWAITRLRRRDEV